MNTFRDNANEFLAISESMTKRAADPHNSHRREKLLADARWYHDHGTMWKMWADAKDEVEAEPGPKRHWMLEAMDQGDATND